MAQRTDPSSQPNPSHKSIKWYESLHFRFVRVQIALLAFIISITVVVIVTVERSLLVDQGLKLSQQLGDRVVAELNDRLSMAESLVTTMANLGESLKPDSDQYMQVVPNLLNFEGEESFIAGGGIWPEPYAFVADKERHSFFWGRNEHGKLIYYNNYNDPTGPGYHHEEWYVPARYYPAGKVFWSKSYMDPYSYQPMVTTTAPMYRDGDFIGVATVDIRLEGLAQFLKEAAEVVGGYIFAVDRNNKLLSFPREDLAKIYTRDPKGNIAEEFINIDDLAKDLPAYQVVSDELNRVNQKINELAMVQPEYRPELVDKLAGDSYQIGEEEARRIAAMLTNPLKEEIRKNKTMEIYRVPVQNDPILHTAVMVSLFYVPDTYWKVAVVTPMSRFYLVANDVTWKVASYMVILEIMALLTMFIILKRLFIDPIKRMSREIKESSQEDRPMHVRLDDSRNDELGVLAAEYNTRTLRLYQAHQEIDKINDELEQRVAQRTMELSSSEQKFRRLIEGLKDDYVIYSFDPRGVYTYVSPSSRSIFGMEPKEMIGRNWTEILNLAPESLSDVQVQENRLRSEKVIVEYTLVYFDELGNRRYLEIKNRPVLDEAQNLIAIEGIGRDITQNKMTEQELHDAQEQLLQSEKMASIGQLAAGVAHEINNPVGFIGSNIQTLEIYIQSIAKVIESYRKLKTTIAKGDIPLLIKEVEELERLEEIVHFNVIIAEIWEIIKESRVGIDRIKKIVNDLRTFSRGDQDFDEVVRLDEVIDSVLGIVHNELKYKVELKKEYGDIPPITCHPQRLGQVFVNLILNAVQAIEHTGVIKVRTYRNGEFVVAEISDTGHGIPADKLSKVFDAFYTTKPVGHGTGLGLSISYDIIKKHGGDILVKSTVGEGTTFTVMLPIR